MCVCGLSTGALDCCASLVVYIFVYMPRLQGSSTIVGAVLWPGRRRGTPILEGGRELSGIDLPFCIFLSNLLLYLTRSHSLPLSIEKISLSDLIPEII